MPCGVHVPTRYGEAGVDGCAGSDVGRFRPIMAASFGLGAVHCYASQETLAKDVRLAMAARNIHSGGLGMFAVGKHRLDVFKGCMPMDMQMFGAGYCYLALFDASVRLRLSRILGPLPLVADVWRLFVHVGKKVLPRCVVSRVGESFHVEEGRFDGKGNQVVFLEGDIQSVAVKIALLVDKEPGVRIGVAGDSEYGVEFPIYKDCDVCGCRVVAFEHYKRCIKPRVKHVSVEYIGDARVALDVKQLLVAGLPVGALYTVHANLFLSSVARESYLKHVKVWQDCGWSASTWGSEFCGRYHGDFRTGYLEWVVGQIAGIDGCDVGKLAACVVRLRGGNVGQVDYQPTLWRAPEGEFGDDDYEEIGEKRESGFISEGYVGTT